MSMIKKVIFTWLFLVVSIQAQDITKVFWKDLNDSTIYIRFGLSVIRLSNAFDTLLITPTGMIFDSDAKVISFELDTLGLGKDVGIPNAIFRIIDSTGTHLWRPDTNVTGDPIILISNSAGVSWDTLVSGDVSGQSDADSIKGIPIQDTTGNIQDNYVMVYSLSDDSLKWEAQGAGTGTADSLIINSGAGVEDTILNDQIKLKEGTNIDFVREDSTTYLVMVVNASDTVSWSFDVDTTGTWISAALADRLPQWDTLTSKDSIKYTGNTDVLFQIERHKVQMVVKITPSSANDSFTYVDTINSDATPTSWTAPLYKMAVTPSSANDAYDYIDTLFDSVASWTSPVSGTDVAMVCDSMVKYINLEPVISDSVLAEDSTTYYIVIAKFGSEKFPNQFEVKTDTAQDTATSVVTTVAMVCDSMVLYVNDDADVSGSITAYDSTTFYIIQADSAGVSFTVEVDTAQDTTTTQGNTDTTVVSAPGTNTLSIGSSERVWFDSATFAKIIVDDSMGIGTADPGARIHVKDSGSQEILVETLDDDDSTRIVFKTPQKTYVVGVRGADDKFGIGPSGLSPSLVIGGVGADTIDVSVPIEMSSSVEATGSGYFKGKLQTSEIVSSHTGDSLYVNDTMVFLKRVKMKGNKITSLGYPTSDSDAIHLLFLDSVLDTADVLNADTSDFAFVTDSIVDDIIDSTKIKDSSVALIDIVMPTGASEGQIIKKVSGIWQIANDATGAGGANLIVYEDSVLELTTVDSINFRRAFTITNSGDGWIDVILDTAWLNANWEIAIATLADTAGSSADQNVWDKAGSMVSNNVESQITVTYQDSTLDFTLDNPVDSADGSERATEDGSGNVISTTYLNKDGSVIVTGDFDYGDKDATNLDSVNARIVEVDSLVALTAITVATEHIDHDTSIVSEGELEDSLDVVRSEVRDTSELVVHDTADVLRAEMDDSVYAHLHDTADVVRSEVRDTSELVTHDTADVVRAEVRDTSELVVHDTADVLRAEMDDSVAAHLGDTANVVRSEVRDTSELVVHDTADILRAEMNDSVHSHLHDTADVVRDEIKDTGDVYYEPVFADSGTWNMIPKAIAKLGLVIGNASDSGVADSNVSTRGYVEKMIEDSLNEYSLTSAIEALIADSLDEYSLTTAIEALIEDSLNEYSLTSAIIAGYLAKADSGTWDEVAAKLVLNQAIIGNASDTGTTDSGAATLGYVQKMIEDSLNEYSLTSGVRAIVHDTADVLRAEMDDSVAAHLGDTANVVRSEVRDTSELVVHDTADVVRGEVRDTAALVAYDTADVVRSEMRDTAALVAHDTADVLRGEMTGEANTLSDTGTYNDTEGFGLAGGKTGVALKVKGLIEGSNITIAKSGDSGLTITAAGGGGGWTDDGDWIRLNTSGDSVAVGQNTGAYKFDVQGWIRGDSIVTDSLATTALEGDRLRASQAVYTGSILPYSGNRIGIGGDFNDSVGIVGWLAHDIKTEMTPDSFYLTRYTIGGLISDTVSNYQPLEATLTDIADGTINENLDNTTNPWADNEIASSGDWNTAFGWGDHNSMQEVFPYFSRKWFDTLGDGANGRFGDSIICIFSDSATKAKRDASGNEITSTYETVTNVGKIGDDTTNFKTAFGWGDHSGQGYEQYDDSGSFQEIPKSVINTQLIIGNASDTSETDSIAATHGWVEKEIEDSLNEYSLTSAIASLYPDTAEVVDTIQGTVPAIIGESLGVYFDTSEVVDTILSSLLDANIPDGITITQASDVDSAGTEISAALGNRIGLLVELFAYLDRTYFDTAADAGGDSVIVVYSDSTDLSIFDTDDLAEGTAKYNVAHTGDVTGATALAIAAQIIVGDDVDSTAENFVFDDPYKGTSAVGDSVLTTRKELGDTAVAVRGDFPTGLTAQAVKGDHVDSTAEDFVFVAAYEGTSAEADSQYSTHNWVQVEIEDSLDEVWTDLDVVDGSEITDQTIKGDDIDSTGENFVFDDPYKGTSAVGDSVLTTRKELGDTATAVRTALHTRSHTVTSTSDHTAGNYKLFHSDGSGEVQELAHGASSKVLTSAGASSAPTWEAPSAAWDWDDSASATSRGPYWVDSADYASKVGAITDAFVAGKLTVTGPIDRYNVKLDFDTANIYCAHADTFLRLPIDTSMIEYVEDSFMIMHPSILYIPEGKWGYKYWLAGTPPAGLGTVKEYIHILVSNDEITWTEFATDTDTLYNPVFDEDDFDSCKYVTDPDIVWDEDGDLFLVFRVTRSFNDSIIHYLYSSTTADGIDWSDTVMMIDGFYNDGTPVTPDTATLSLMSPGVIMRGAGDYFMYTSEDTGGEFTRAAWEAPRIDTLWDNASGFDSTILFGTTPLNSDTVRISIVHQTFPDGNMIFHADEIVYGSDLIVNLVGTYSGAQYPHIYMGLSTDGEYFNTVSTPLLDTTNNATAWDRRVLYRASGYFIDYGTEVVLRMYYCAQNEDDSWYTGLTDIHFGAVLNVKELLIWNPDLITDTVPISEADSTKYPGGITIQSVAVQTSEDGEYVLKFMSFTAADPPVFHDWVDTLNVGASDQRASSILFEDDDSPLIDRGQELYILTPSTDIDWIKVKYKFFVRDWLE